MLIHRLIELEMESQLIEVMNMKIHPIQLRFRRQCEMPTD
jgi:hypothetical protein